LNRRLQQRLPAFFQGLFYDEHDADGRARGIGDLVLLVVCPVLAALSLVAMYFDWRLASS
jgi:hypothetical protein